MLVAHSPPPLSPLPTKGRTVHSPVHVAPCGNSHAERVVVHALARGLYPQRDGGVVLSAQYRVGCLSPPLFLPPPTALRMSTSTTTSLTCWPTRRASSLRCACIWISWWYVRRCVCAASSRSSCPLTSPPPPPTLVISKTSLYGNHPQQVPDFFRTLLATRYAGHEHHFANRPDLCDAFAPGQIPTAQHVVGQGHVARHNCLRRVRLLTTCSPSLSLATAMAMCACSPRPLSCSTPRCETFCLPITWRRSRRRCVCLRERERGGGLLDAQA